MTAYDEEQARIEDSRIVINQCEDEYLIITQTKLDNRNDNVEFYKLIVIERAPSDSEGERIIEKDFACKVTRDRNTSTVVSNIIQYHNALGA